MATVLPVDILDANSIKLNAKPLLDSNGDLSYNGKIIASRSELITIHVVSTTIERDLLTPKTGDICKITSTSESFIYNDTWVPLTRNEFSVFTVGSFAELSFIVAIAGDMANVTNENKSYFYSGTEWIEILTGNIEIDDTTTSETSVWSSYKTDYEIKNHQLDGGIF